MNLNLWNKCLFSLSLLFEVISRAADLYMYIYLYIFFITWENEFYHVSAGFSVLLGLHASTPKSDHWEWVTEGRAWALCRECQTAYAMVQSPPLRVDANSTQGK